MTSTFLYFILLCFVSYYLCDISKNKSDYCTDAQKFSVTPHWLHTDSSIQSYSNCIPPCVSMCLLFPFPFPWILPDCLKFAKHNMVIVPLCLLPGMLFPPFLLFTWQTYMILSKPSQKGSFSMKSSLTLPWAELLTSPPGLLLYLPPYLLFVFWWLVLVSFSFNNLRVGRLWLIPSSAWHVLLIFLQ